MVFLKSFDNVVRSKEQFILKTAHICFFKSAVCIVKKLICLIYDEFVTQIVFILEIQVKSSFCKAGLLDNIRNCCFGKSFSCEKMKGSFEKCALFLLFIIINFARNRSPLIFDA